MKRIHFSGGSWSNADADRIEFAEADPEWPARFAAEAERIREALGTRREVRIEHVGSTAVPGLAAKPILDILLIVPGASGTAWLVGALESLGYAYWAENPRQDRMFFVKGMPPFGEARTHHVHVRGPQEARDMLLFRDYLVSNPQAAARYEALKRDLARRHSTDREAYTCAKEEFIKAVLERALGDGYRRGSREPGGNRIGPGFFSP